LKFLENYRRDLCDTLQKIDLAKVRQAVDWLKQTRGDGRCVYTCGNGSSASTASHLVGELVKTVSYGKTARFRAIALADCVPAITALGNDVGYDAIFVEPLRNFARGGDVLVVFSGSGNSPNVVGAVEYARAAGCRTISLTGRDGGKLGRAADLNILVPAQHMGIIEDAHLVICHMIAYHIMECDD
jgi:D-sedoheptulose 7-phosphate isomerase